MEVFIMYCADTHADIIHADNKLDQEFVQRRFWEKENRKRQAEEKAEAEFNKKFDAYEEEKAVYKQALIAEGTHPVEADMIADELAMYLLK